MKYERLTKRFRNSQMQQDVELMTTVSNGVFRLAELEDKIENGTLIELPCKVGDTVYTIDINNQGKRFINEVKISEIVIFGNGIYYNDNLGVWIFEIYTTKAEAEKKLQELQE